MLSQTLKFFNTLAPRNTLLVARQHSAVLVLVGQTVSELNVLHHHGSHLITRFSGNLDIAFRSFPSPLFTSCTHSQMLPFRPHYILIKELYGFIVFQFHLSMIYWQELEQYIQSKVLVHAILCVLHDRLALEFLQSVSIRPPEPFPVSHWLLLTDFVHDLSEMVKQSTSTSKLLIHLFRSGGFEVAKGYKKGLCHINIIIFFC